MAREIDEGSVDLSKYCDLNTLQALFPFYEAGIDGPESMVKELWQSRYRDQIIRTSGWRIDWPNNLGDIIKMQWKLNPQAVRYLQPYADPLWYSLVSSIANKQVMAFDNRSGLIEAAEKIYGTKINRVSAALYSLGGDYEAAFVNQFMQNFNLEQARNHVEDIWARLKPGATLVIVSKAKPEKLENLGRKVDVIHELSSEECLFGFVEDKRILPAVSQISDAALEAKNLPHLIVDKLREGKRLLNLWNPEAETQLMLSHGFEVINIGMHPFDILVTSGSGWLMHVLGLRRI